MTECCTVTDPMLYTSTVSEPGVVTKTGPSLAHCEMLTTYRAVASHSSGNTRLQASMSGSDGGILTFLFLESTCKISCSICTWSLTGRFASDPVWPLKHRKTSTGMVLDQTTQFR